MAKLHLIGNAHIDPVWLWRWQEGYNEVLCTFRSALDRMKDFDDFEFTSACALYYQWVEKTDPEMFAEIQQRVKEGRWHIVGGWLLQPDCNLPSGESFARHALISQRYFKEKFGVTATTGYNVDSFGHNASLPMILRQSGMKNYVFMRPGPHENAGLYDFFIWESADGSKVTTARVPENCYCIDFTRLEMLDRVHETRDADGMPHMCFVGVGNHGGGPTLKLLEELKARNYHDTEFSSPDKYFADLDASSLCTVKDELQHHAVGCYSANSGIKAMNRRSENNLLLAEKLSVMANKLTGLEYPTKRLNKAWKNTLFNQFHDILGGCSIESAYTDASYLYGETMSITEQIIQGAMQKICSNINTLRGHVLPAHKYQYPNEWLLWNHEELGTPIVVFNTHSWEVTSIVKLTVPATKMCDEKGNDVPFQLTRSEATNGRAKFGTAFEATVPAFGYAVYRLFTAEDKTADISNVLSVTEYSLENDKIRVEFDKKRGEISAFINKQTGENILAAPCRSVLLDETDCDTWAHAKAKLGEVVGIFTSPVFTVRETGPARAVLNIVTTHGSSTISRDYILSANSDTLKVETEIDLHEKHKTLKFTFPSLRDRPVKASIPYGVIERTVRDQEEPFSGWLACEGLGVATDSKYGYDTEGDEMRISVLRSAIFADHFGVRDDRCRFMEQGISRFSYCLFPYTDALNAHRRTEELCCELRALACGFQNGKLPERESFMSVDSDAILVTAIKQSEDTNEVIIRALETAGNDVSTSITFFGSSIPLDVSHSSITTVTEHADTLNLLEENI